ncbi:hypothetical protein GFL91_07005 [Rhizobium leguminosarum bv. viciae]|uniref:Transmembrane protein n=1 Tax=Rhizobium leguminosarum bv. viciae TaxID=387 RepID=A0A8I2GST2_RHILV|nr:hypothetical protein [Rhizobium leguminosarum]MBY5793106.1 hypothetical protein [Rhizobium leguminosarum]NKM44739.1 hypothetical protein [Rhizobium leguminosarum bv. viciae]
MAKSEKYFRDFRERRGVNYLFGKFVRILADFIMFFPPLGAALIPGIPTLPSRMLQIAIIRELAGHFFATFSQI